MTGIEILAEYTEGGQPVAALTVLGILSLIFLALTVLQLVNDEPGEFFKPTDSSGSVGTVGTPINMERE